MTATPSPAVVFVETTVASEEQAHALADLVIQQRLGACVSVLEQRSTYRWRGAVECTQEYLLRIKTQSAQVNELVSRLRQSHPYEVPEIISYEGVSLHPDYSAWLQESLSPQR